MVRSTFYVERLTSMEIEKVFVKADNMATIRCQECGLNKNLLVAKYRNRKTPLKIRCRCNHVFAVSFEFRQHFRKPVILTGTYLFEPPASGSGSMTVENISRSGIGFIVSGTHVIELGQKAKIKFTLSNRKQTRMEKKVEIVSIKGNHIGGTFLDDQQFEKDLGFFLRSDD